MEKNDAWSEYNKAMTDGSLHTAPLRRLRWYLKAVNDRRPATSPYADKLQQLISQREGQRQARWTVVGALAAIAAAIASVLGLVVAWRQIPN